MATQDLPNEWGEFVVTLLGGKRLEVSEERRSETKLHLVDALFRLEFLGCHCKRSDALAFGCPSRSLCAPDVRPINLGADALRPHLPAAFAFDIDGNVRRARLAAIRDIVQMTFSGPAPLREWIALGARERQPKYLELHGGADYHHRVIGKSIPFADFTKWWSQGDTNAMNSGEIQNRRRDALRAYLKSADLSLNAFVLEIGHSQSHLQAALRGQKPFGEKLARTIEKKVAAKGLPPIKLFAPDGMPLVLPQGMRLSALEQELLDVFHHLSPERQAQVVKDLAVEAIRQTVAPRGPPATPETDPAAGRRYG